MACGCVKEPNRRAVAIGALLTDVPPWPSLAVTNDEAMSFANSEGLMLLVLLGATVIPAPSGGSRYTPPVLAKPAVLVSPFGSSRSNFR